MEREVALMEVLEAREARVRQQNIFLEQHGAPVVSFTLNIAGPVKDSPRSAGPSSGGRTSWKRACGRPACPFCPGT